MKGGSRRFINIVERRSGIVDPNVRRSGGTHTLRLLFNNVFAVAVSIFVHSTRPTAMFVFESSSVLFFFLASRVNELIFYKILISLYCHFTYDCMNQVEYRCRIVNENHDNSHNSHIVYNSFIFFGWFTVFQPAATLRHY